MTHAYLIIAHNEFTLLRKLLNCLDYLYNDIFLHIDKKADIEKLGNIRLKYAELHIYQEINVQWGGTSQIECELRLFEHAIENSNAEYFHLLSGVDLPLKKQNDIHEFFEINRGYEFIHFDTYMPAGDNVLSRVQLYHLFPFNSKKSNYNLNRYLTWLQRKLLIKRRHSINFYKGANWCSVTRKFVEMLLENSAWVSKEFAYSKCADELYKQTLFVIHKDEFKLYKDTVPNDYHAIMRNIDWQRGDPYVWQAEDYDELINSDYLFARKFSMERDEKIVDMIVDGLLNS